MFSIVRCVLFLFPSLLHYSVLFLIMCMFVSLGVAALCNNAIVMHILHYVLLCNQFNNETLDYFIINCHIINLPTGPDGQ